MKTTNTFSINRFGRYAAAELTAQKRQLILNIGTLAAAVFIIYILCGMIFFIGAQVLPENMFVARSLSCFVMSVMLINNVCNSFRSYHKTLSAPHAMLLPVAKSEKFIFALVCNLICVPLVVYGCYKVIDFAMISLYGVQYQDIGVSIDLSEVYSFVDVVLSIAMIGTTCFLGSILFRRNQFLYTILSVVGISTIFSFAVIAYVELIRDDTSFFLIIPHWLSNLIQYGVQSIVIVALVWLSWYKFNKIQIR